MNSPQKTSFGLIFLLWVAGISAGGQFAKITVIFPEIQALYPGASGSIGFAVTLISILGVVFGLFAGLIISRVGFRKMLLFGLALGAMLSFVQSSFPSMWILLATRVVEGISHLIIVVAAPTLIVQVCKDNHRAAAMTLWSTFFGVSFALFAWLGLPLVANFGPSSLFWVHGGLMLSVALGLALRLPEKIVAPNKTESLKLFDLLARHVEVYKSAAKSTPALGWLFYTLTYVSVLTVLPTIAPEEERAMFTKVLPLAGLVSALTIGMILLQFLRATQVVIIGFIGAILASVVFFLFPTQALIIVLLLVVLGLVQSGSFAAVPELNKDAVSQAHANGAIAQMGNLGNLLGTPLLLAAYAVGGETGMIAFLIVCYGCGFLVYSLYRFRSE